MFEPWNAGKKKPLTLTVQAFLCPHKAHLEQICNCNLARADYQAIRAIKTNNGSLNFYEKAVIWWDQTF